MVGVYEVGTGLLLERCNENQLTKALDDWNALGYNVCIGSAFQNLIYLY